MKVGELVGVLSLTSLILLGCDRKTAAPADRYDALKDGVSTDVTSQSPDLSILQPPPPAIIVPVAPRVVATAPATEAATTEAATTESATPPATAPGGDVQNAPPP